MEITEIRIKLMDDQSDRLQAFCSITFDGCFVIRDLKIIQGAKGPFLAMPSRKLMDRCPRCSGKNHLRARYCNECGCVLQHDRAVRGGDGRAKLYADIAHPINCDSREHIQARVVEAYGEELERAKLPGYICNYDDFGEENFAVAAEEYDVDAGHLRGAAPFTTTNIATATQAPPRPTYINRVARLEDDGFPNSRR